MGCDLFFGTTFLFFLFYFGMRKTKNIKTESAYLIANRNTSIFPLTATLVMTEFNTATLISFSSLGYLAGLRALFLPGVFLIGLLFYAFSVAKKWKAFNGISVANYFTKRYGKDIGILASIALLTAMAGFSATYIKSLCFLFTPLFPNMHTWVLSSLLTVFVLLMILRGGLFSIIRTDVMSFLAVVCFFPILLFFSYQSSLNSDIQITESTSSFLPFRFIVSLIVLTMFTYILAPWYGQKIFAAKTKKTAYFSVVLAAVFVFVLYGMAVLTTWFLRKKGAILSNPEEALPSAIKLLPSGLRGIGFGILFAASATTLSGVWSAMSSLIVGDFFQIEGKENYKRCMLLTLGFACLSLLLANILVDKVFDKLILANIPIAALSFALLGGFYWKKANRYGAYVSILIGWIWGVFSYLYFGEAREYTWYWAIYGILFIFISGILVSLLTNSKKIINYQ